jgi:hypothetical protein
VLLFCLQSALMILSVLMIRAVSDARTDNGSVGVSGSTVI